MSDDGRLGSVQRGRRRRIGAVLVVLLVVGVVAAPQASRRMVAAVTVAEGLGFDVPRPLAASFARAQVTLGAIEVDRYSPQDTRSRSRAPIVLIPGATPAGRDDPRVVDVATALARAGRPVFVPELEVYEERLVTADVARIVEVALAAAGETGGVVFAGISFGGSLGLIAAGDPRLAGRVDLVATFGAYADLAGVVQAAITGESLVGGERFAWEPDPRAVDIVHSQVLGRLASDGRAQVEATLSGGRDPDVLSAQLRAVHDLLVHDDPARTMDYLEQLPAAVREQIAQVSPIRAAADLQVPIIALHAVDDPVIPYGELARLRAAYPQTEALTLATFDHVGLGEDASWWVTGRDLWRTVGFVTRILERT